MVYGIDNDLPHWLFVLHIIHVFCVKKNDKIFHLKFYKVILENVLMCCAQKYIGKKNKEENIFNRKFKARLILIHTSVVRAHQIKFTRNYVIAFCLAFSLSLYNIISRA